MGLWDSLRNELIDIIEWKDDSGDTLVWRFERHDDEIKNGAQLTVREGQVAVLINEGQLADVFKPGRHVLATANLPILATLKGWKYGFDSPFKAEVYFVSTRNFTDQKWGTKSPIMLRDAEFGPVRLRAFGSYVFRVSQADVFIREIVGTDGHFTTDEVTNQLRNLIVTRFTDALGESKLPVLDLAANYDELSALIHEKIGPEFGEYGFELTKFLVENISLPPAVEEALDKRSSMGIIGNLGQYAQYQAANAMETAAANPGGEASAGIGMGMGFAMANQMGQMLNPQNAATAPPVPGAAPPPPPPVPQALYYVAAAGQQTGPYPPATLQAMAAQGSLTAASMVWAQGMAAWLPAGQVPELAAIFATPPPLPPPPPPPPPA
jgi:membrane protease subunit (stomatin/prohibitin family)